MSAPKKPPPRSLVLPALPADPVHARHRRLRWHTLKKQLLMLLLGFIVGLEFLENGMFVFAASYIVGGIDAAPREFSQALAAYAIGSMLMIGMQQWLSRHFGYRRYLTASLALFLAGALGSAAASGIDGLILARGIQGFGGGALFTSCRVLIPALFKPQDRPKAAKYFMLTVFSIGTLSPLLAAELVNHWGWRSIFISVTPLAALAMLGAWKLIPQALGHTGDPVRWAIVPLVLFAATITVVQLGFSEARYDLFGHPGHLLALMLTGMALFACFTLHQWRHHEPLFLWRELTHPAYLLGLVLYFLFYCLSNTSSYMFPILAEQGLGIPLTTTGLLNSFAAAVSLAAAYGYLKLGARIGAKKPLMVVGALAMVLSAWSFASLPADAPASALLPALAGKGIFGVLLVLPIAGYTFHELGEHHFSHAYQNKNLIRQLAASFATAITAITLQNRQLTHQAQLASVIDGANPASANWFDTLQSSLTLQGMTPSAAHGTAIAVLRRIVDQQSLLLACQDLFRITAALAVITAIAVCVQRRFK